MTKNFFDDLSEKRKDAINVLDTTKFGPAIRNPLVQLFRKARAVDSGLTGLIVGMGSISIQGTVYVRWDNDPEAGVVTIDANDYKYAGGFTVEHPEAESFLEACEAYDESGLACDCPIADITLDDIRTRRSVKAKIWGHR